METLKITPHETVEVRHAGEDALEVEVTYGTGGRKPPAHFHPDQDEHFEVHEGELHARVAGKEQVLRAGDTLDIPRGTVHQMWNAGDGPARASWTTTPALRTLEWFRAIDGATPAALIGLLRQYDDVFRLTGAAGVVARIGKRSR